MNIQELELKHWQVSPKYGLGNGVMETYDAKKHVYLSIQFAIEMLEDSQKGWGYFDDHVFNKIEELKKYL